MGSCVVQMNHIAVGLIPGWGRPKAVKKQQNKNKNKKTWGHACAKITGACLAFMCTAFIKVVVHVKDPMFTFQWQMKAYSAGCKVSK